MKECAAAARSAAGVRTRRAGRSPRHPDPRAPLDPAAALLLQRMAGNAAVGTLLGRGVPLQRAFGNRAVVDFLAADPAVVPQSHPAEVEATRAEHAAGPPSRAAGVRLHTDGDAAALAGAMGAEAITWNRNVFFGRGRYAPGTAQGDRLLRHEMTHAAHHPAQHAHLKPVTRRLDFMKIKKIPIGVHREIFGRMLGRINELKGAAKNIRPPKGQGDGGHWWTELGVLGTQGTWNPTESYGWWPPDIDGRSEAKPLKVWEVLKLKKVEGQLNQDGAVDPHHGDNNAPVDYHPAVTVDDTQSYSAVRLDYERMVRTFAKRFEGSWNWRLNWGKNCHTFIDRLERHIGARRDDSAEMLADPRRNAAPNAINLDRSGIVKDLARLRGLGSNSMLLVHELGQLKKKNLVPEAYVRDVLFHQADDAVRQDILDMVGCDRDVMNRAIAAVYGRGWTNVF